MRILCIAAVIPLVLATVLSAAGLDGLDEELRKKWPDSRTINMVFHGHSVPAGYHRTPEVKPFESYPHLFAVRLKEKYPHAVVNVITTAIGGENSIAGAARFEDDVLTHRPDLVFVDYALNDRSRPLAEVEVAWRTMITAAKAAGVPVVLVTPTGASDADMSDRSDPLTKRAELIRRLAAEEDVLLADVSRAWLAELASGTAQDELLSQVNHPNLAGHAVAADALFASFVDAIPASGRIPAADFRRNATPATSTAPSVDPDRDGGPERDEAVEGADLPNVLWITLEDTSPHFIGCYGNAAAKTPHIDRLAARGIRLDRAFANAPVCSSARSTIITGVLNETLGTGNHRSRFPLPGHIKGFPTFLREVGFYTTNNRKTDYSTSSEPRLIRESWNESSRRAGWETRGSGQPFFSVFNVEHCHQSRTMTWSYDWYRKNIFGELPEECRVADDGFPMPPFIPNTVEFRKHFARVYNSIARADQEVGDILARLESDGLTDDTIVFCYADHGEAMPRGKANPIGLGYRVPFIVAFPEKWQHLNPWGEAGSASDELVCFDDLGPTMLSLAGRKPAPWMTGRAFLGEHRAAPRDHVFCSRNRIDESPACSRSVTDGRYLYTRHFLPGPEFRRVKYFDVSDIARLLRRDHAAGTLDRVQDGMFQPQPPEVLHDLEADPWETRNLAGDPEQSLHLARLRTALFKHIAGCRDVMIRPEFDLDRISQGSTPYDHGAGCDPDELAAILDAADRSSRPEVDPVVLKILASDLPVVTYWAATALRANPAYRRDTVQLAEVGYPPAAIEFAAARFLYDDDPAAAALLRKHALSDNPHLRLHALQRIQDFGKKAASFHVTLEEAARGGTYDSRCCAEVTLHLLDGRPISYPDPK